jgi:hypothetical protein
MKLSRLLWLPACFGLVFVAGCSDSSVSVSGKLIPPADVKIEKSDSVNITFTPAEGSKGKPWVGVFSPDDNTFAAKEVVPGSYKVSVFIQPYPGEKGSEKRMETLQDVNARFSADKSNLKTEITGDRSQSITVDMKSNTVTKG